MQNTNTLSIVLTKNSLKEDNKGEVQLLPLGYFSATDGRPGTEANYKYWQTTSESLEFIAQTLNLKPKNSFVIDYEHQTIYADLNGQPAPAAGWGHSFEVREDGIYAKVEWTKKAKEYIKNQEYKYISPVFGVNSKGAVIELLHAGLTNTPALPQLTQICNKHFKKPQEKKMNIQTQENEETQETKADQTEAIAKEWDRLNLAKAQMAVDSAISHQLLTPAQSEAALELAKADLEGFNKFVQTLKPSGILNLQTAKAKNTATDEQKEPIYTAAQIHAAKMLGMEVEQLCKIKTEKK